LLFPKEKARALEEEEGTRKKRRPSLKEVEKA